MTTTFFVPGGKAECRVLSSEAAIFVEISGGSFVAPHGDIDAESLEEGIKHLANANLGQYEGAWFFRGHGQILHYLPFSFAGRDREFVLGRIERKLDCLRDVIAEAKALDCNIIYS